MMLFSIALLSILLRTVIASLPFASPQLSSTSAESMGTRIISAGRALPRRPNDVMHQSSARLALLVPLRCRQSQKLKGEFALFEAAIGTKVSLKDSGKCYPKVRTTMETVKGNRRGNCPRSIAVSPTPRSWIKRDHGLSQHFSPCVHDIQGPKPATFRCT